jgi:uncharacterized membrane protein
VAKAATKAATKTVAPGGGKLGLGATARMLARKALKRIAGRAAGSGAETVRAAAERTAEVGKTALEDVMNKRPPIQCSIDVAVPLRVAWEEWIELSFLPEGVHRIEEIERDGDALTGSIAERHSNAWAADILDEREQQSFAWQSTEGSDCAGLVTFHELSDRLTRIELNLDVLPTSVAQALAVSVHLADRRAEADLRRFKARLELINPDLYETETTETTDNTETTETTTQT